jgi:hypothetical protein
MSVKKHVWILIFCVWVEEFLSIADDIRGSMFRPMEIGWNV